MRASPLGWYSERRYLDNCSVQAAMGAGKRPGWLAVRLGIFALTGITVRARPRNSSESCRATCSGHDPSPIILRGGEECDKFGDRPHARTLLWTSAYDS